MPSCKMTFKPMNSLMRFFLPDWVHGLTIPPFGMYLRHPSTASASLKKHEQQHWTQYQRLGLVKFVVLYNWYTIRYGYTNNPFEVEAREAERH